MDDRLVTLGFSPQKEIPYNRHLPYSDKLDIESNEYLGIIKANLAKTVQVQDVKIGATHWTAQLAKYIRLYGHKFSKEDHIAFVYLLFELTTIPDLDYSLVQKFSVVLSILLKKKELLTRDDILLPWKPLYRLLENLVYSPYEYHGLVLLPSTVESVLKNLVRLCRPYFGVEATQEMLDEWHPLMCPYDVSMLKAMYYFERFLPTCLPRELHDRGFKLWFEEFIGIWNTCRNNPSWEVNLVHMFARLSHDTIGYIDWEPYMPMIFTRILRSFDVPIGNLQVHTNSNSAYDLTNTAWWIVSMLGGGSACQSHLNQLFESLESSYHPSNVGSWNMKLMKLLLKLPQSIVRRLYRERHQQSWRTPVASTHRLTEDDITRFVECLHPILLLAMFSKVGTLDSAVAYQHLAALRPHLILPPLLERTYPAFETLVEPHRLIACVQCIVAGMRTMLDKRSGFASGPLNVVPLLQLSLPGIDSNDLKKCLNTFQLISTLASLVLIVDCSGAIHCRTDLTDEEKELCSATAQFGDFVMQFLDKMFELIENSTPVHTRSDNIAAEKLNQEESMLEVGLLSTFNAILQQCSAKIYEDALKKLFRFVSNNVYEIRVAGRFTSNIIRAAIKINPEKGFKVFIMHFCTNIKSHAANDDLSKEEHLDNEFLWNLKMLSQAVRSDGRSLLTYRAELVSVLRLCVHARCKEAAELACQLLRHTLRALTVIYALNYRSVPVARHDEESLTEYLPTRDWGKCGDLNDLQMKWHVSSPEEKAFAKELLQLFLAAELDKVKTYVSEDGSTMTRDELLQSLCIIHSCLTGAAAVLPMWQGEDQQLVECQVDLGGCTTTLSVDSADIQLNCENTRLTVVKAMRPLLEYLLSKHEDDTKSLVQIVQIYRSLMCNFGSSKEDFENKWKGLHMVKKLMENKLMGKKCHMRALLVDRVQLQHELRIINKSLKVFTETHKDLMKDLFHLSVSRYSEVRKVAQKRLSQAFQMYAYSYRTILDDVLACLEESPANQHHHFKGALYLVMGENRRSLATKRSWDVIVRVWPALVRAQHSERPSVLRIIDSCLDRLHKYIESTEIAINVHDGLLAAGDKLSTSTSQPRPSLEPVTDAERADGAKAARERNEQSLGTYVKLTEILADLIKNGQLRWKFQEMALSMLSLLVRIDAPVSHETVHIFVQNTIHETLRIRKLCLGTLSAILKMQKRPHKKAVIDPYAIAGVKRPETPVLQPGDRPDNRWLCYDNASLPLDTQEKWDACRFIEKTHWGYYCWPKKMYEYAPPSEQPDLGRSLQELSDAEKPIYESFTDATFVDKFIQLISMEENKGKDKFHAKYFMLFKGLFRNFDDTFMPLLRPHIERLAADMKPATHEASQRCSAELISGLIRGSKHWTFDKVKAMWSWLLPVVKQIIMNLSIESVSLWGTCFATAMENKDPRKLAPLLNLMMENLLQGDGGSFSDFSRLYVLQGGLAQQEWRIPSILQYLLDYITPHLDHSYKNVRDRIGSLLVNIFMMDFALPNGSSYSPKRAPFIKQLRSQLEILAETKEAEPMDGTRNSSDTSLSASSSDEHMTDDIEMTSPTVSGRDSELACTEESEERKAAKRLCETMMKWFQGCSSRLFCCLTPEIFSFLPILCLLESDGKDAELKFDCRITLAYFSHGLLSADLVPTVLDTITEVCRMRSWHARAAILNYVQSMVFCNLFLLSEPKTRDHIQHEVTALLSDEQVEVRELAYVTLSGFLQCRYITHDDKMMAEFHRLSATRLGSRGHLATKSTRLRQRHAGVLGLCACVEAFPYDVPIFIPDILMTLSRHLNDPQPIQRTVKKTLSNFKRTHHDNWLDHKQKFTDDQLVVLTDLLVSPNYYA